MGNFKLVLILKDKKTNDIKSICKQIGVKGLTGAKKDYLIHQVLLHNLSNMKFTLPSQNEIKKEDKLVETVTTNLIEELEKQKLQIELKLKEETKKQLEEQKKGKTPLDRETYIKNKNERIEKEMN